MAKGSVHLQKLPKKIQAAVVIEMQRQHKTNELNDDYQKTSTFILLAFSWMSTTQGDEFWRALYTKLFRHENRL